MLATILGTKVRKGTAHLRNVRIPRSHYIRFQLWMSLGHEARLLQQIHKRTEHIELDVFFSFFESSNEYRRDLREVKKYV